ncbi:hypothetical protein SEA_CHEWYVIII_13 [Rhodococcus phage ChewyVIII]|uniref:Uncharacterized protein n=1 Tax=Rhodococcus phage ChewyVIII TaxID=1887657 RepID=A0A1C9EI30_9CAUD|nr:hypothetical protein QEH30_gp13 [Rhodococcus phage ChewyVIII]AON97436.1 hypothetical protein SEA_CHEWYVIII_13 [Rhodococcus phage ChewyVIII]
MKLSRLGKLRKPPHVPTITHEPMKYHLPPKDTTMTDDSQPPVRFSDAFDRSAGDSYPLGSKWALDAYDEDNELPHARYRAAEIHTYGYVLGCTPKTRAKRHETPASLMHDATTGRTEILHRFCARCKTETIYRVGQKPEVQMLSAASARTVASALDRQGRTAGSDILKELVFASAEEFYQYAQAKEQVERAEAKVAKPTETTQWVVYWDGLEIGEVEAAHELDAWAVAERNMSLRKRDI